MNRRLTDILGIALVVVSPNATTGRTAVRRTLLLLVVVLCAALAGCGGSGENDSGDAGGTPGGVLRVAESIGTPSDTLDPFRRQFSNVELMGVGMLFDALVRVDVRLTPQPGISTSWESSDDLTTWTISLRDDVKFHDGTPMTAKDVVYSIKQAIDPKGGSPLASQLGPILKPANITASGDHEVVLKLNSPYAFIPFAMGNRYMRVVKDGAKDYSAPIGTGPFKFKEFAPGKRLVVEKNPDYWRDGLPKLDRVEIITIPEASSKLQALFAGDIDVADGIDYAQIPAVENSEGHRLIKLDDLTIYGVDIDITKKPFDDPRVVEAFKLAIDREALVKTVLNGAATVGYDTTVPTNDPYFDETLKSRAVRDVERAKALLAEAGYPNGIEQEFIVSPVGSSIVNLGVALKEQLAEAGFRLKIRLWPASTFFDNVWLKKPLYLTVYFRRHPNDNFTILATSKGSWNATHWANPEFDKAVAAAREASTFEEQKAAYAKAQQLMAAEDGHVIPVFGAYVSAVSNKVKGLKLNYIEQTDFSEATVR